MSPKLTSSAHVVTPLTDALMAHNLTPSDLSSSPTLVVDLLHHVEIDGILAIFDDDICLLLACGIRRFNQFVVLVAIRMIVTVVVLPLPLLLHVSISMAALQKSVDGEDAVRWKRG